MKVEFEGHKYKVDWRHGWVAVMEGGAPDICPSHIALTRTPVFRREYTECLISDTSGDVPLDAQNPHPPVIAKGVAVRYFKDTPNRKIARKKALANALLGLDVNDYPSIRTSGYAHLRLSRDNDLKRRRRAFWKAYQMRGLPTIAEMSGLLSKGHASSQALGDASREPESKPPLKVEPEKERLD